MLSILKGFLKKAVTNKESQGNETWRQDLDRDIRKGDLRDDEDGPEKWFKELKRNYTEQEFSACNHSGLKEALAACGTVNAILEIGVNRNKEASSTQTFLAEKSDQCTYLGIDIEDKSFLNDSVKKINTLKIDSSKTDVILNHLQSLGVDTLDFLFIDGWHSINQVLSDWEFTKILRRGGVVAFHDTTAHPGPHYFLKHLRKDRWEVKENICPQDNGFGYAIKIKT